MLSDPISQYRTVVLSMQIGRLNLQLKSNGAVEVYGPSGGMEIEPLELRILATALNVLADQHVAMNVPPR